MPRLLFKVIPSIEAFVTAYGLVSIDVIFESFIDIFRLYLRD